MTNITNNVIQKAVAKPSAYFIRDDKLRGFAVKINPTGTIKYIAEAYHAGQSTRITLGDYPLIPLKEARLKAIEAIRLVKSGQYHKDQPKRNINLLDLSESYLNTKPLKPNTIRNHREVIRIYLYDWLNKPVNTITKGMVEKRFYKIRDKGIKGGKPTYSQATKSMRILSALMNYALADDLIESNPVQILKLKRIDRSIQKRTNYLPLNKARELASICTQDAHPVSIAVHLMLHTGMRKNEAMRIKWSDIEFFEGIECILLKDTKNKRIHYIPVTNSIRSILNRARSKSPYVFPSVVNQDTYVKDERNTIRRLSKAIKYDFRCHDLRRTFATRAMEVGIDYLMVKRLLNHKSNDITAQYIQWNSKENLLSMQRALESIVY